MNDIGHSLTDLTDDGHFNGKAKKRPPHMGYGKVGDRSGSFQEWEIIVCGRSGARDRRRSEDGIVISIGRSFWGGC